MQNNKNNDADVPTMVREILRHYKYTHVQLAHVLEVSSGTINRWLHDKVMPHPTFVKRLEKMYGSTKK